MRDRLRRLPARLNPYIAAACAALVVLVAATWDRQTTARYHQLKAAQAGMQDAVSLSKRSLAGAMDAALGEASIKRHLDRGLQHSVKQSLSGKLSPGLWDGVIIWDEQCRPLVRAGRETSPEPRCPQAGQAPRTLRWALADPIRLERMQPLSVRGQRLTAIGYVVLDAAWMSHYTSLQRAAGSVEASIVRPGISDGIDLHVFQGQDSQALASLATSRWLDRGIEINSPAPSTSGLYWLGFVALLLLLSWGYYRQRQFEHVTKRGVREHLEWCRSLTPLAAYKPPGQSHEPKEPSLSYQLRQAQKAVSQGLQVKIEKIRELSAEFNQTAQQLQKTELDNQQLAKQLSGLAELNSLAQQLSRSTGSFRSKMVELQAATDDAADLICASLAERSQSLATMLTAWQAGVAERGSRKFIRSLAETAGQDPSQTQLDEQIAGMTELANSIRDLAMSMASRAHSLGETAEYAARTSGIWHQLAASDQRDQCQGADLQGILLDAAELVLLERGDQFRFVDRTQENVLNLAPALPRRIWTAAFYHLFNAVMGEADPAEATVLFGHTRQQDHRGLMILNRAAKSGHAQRKPDAQELEFARAILAPYGVQVTALPALDGAFPVAISFTPPALAAAPEQRDQSAAGPVETTV